MTASEQFEKIKKDVDSSEYVVNIKVTNLSESDLKEMQNYLFSKNYTVEYEYNNTQFYVLKNSYSRVLATLSKTAI